MSDERRPRKPRRRRRRRWQYYIPTVIMLTLAIVCISVIGWAVAAVIGSFGDNNDGGGISTNTTATQNTQPTTAPPKGPNEEEAAALIAEADFIAAGYDYQKAIKMLKDYEFYEEFPEMKQRVADYTEADSKLITYAKPETVTHIFFHSLIVDTNRAFDGDYEEDGYNMYMTTVEEFIGILNQMYDRGYVLISPYDLAYEVTNADGTTSFKYGNIRIPAGKTPFLMSQDDVNYYSYMISSGNGKNETPYFNDETNDGFASRIVIDKETGYPVCEYVDANGTVHYGDYDLVPVLETFIQEHPDFSYHGARAILGVTGYEGVFGYRTKDTYKDALNAMYESGQYPYSYDEEVQMAKDVAQCLRDHGWILASHSYGHPAYGNISAERVEADSDRWEVTVESIIGETDVILFPHGSDIHTWRNYTFDNAKFAALYEDGYRYFFNVDGNTYWNQLGSNYFRGGRRNLDGYRMYYNPTKLSDLFDVESVFDKARPLPVPSIGGGM